MVEPWISSSMSAGRSPLLRMQSMMPWVSCAGVVRLFASTNFPALSSNPTRSVNVPPMSIATKITPYPHPQCPRLCRSATAFAFARRLTVNSGLPKHPTQGERALPTLKDLIAGDDLVVAPVALNPVMARLAAQAGFKAVYLSGGSLGWVKCVTEANLTLPELAEVA